MHVLQHAAARIRDTEAEIRLRPLVPGGLQVRHLQVTGDQRALQVEAHHDVEVVVDLVGLGADEAPLHHVHRPPERIRVGRRRGAELGRHRAVQPAGEGAAAAELVLEQARLALVHGHRRRLPGGERREAGV